MKLNIPVLTNARCQERWDDNIIGAIHPILDVHVCVGDENGELSACQVQQIKIYTDNNLNMVYYRKIKTVK